MIFNKEAKQLSYKVISNWRVNQQSYHPLRRTSTQQTHLVTRIAGQRKLLFYFMQHSTHPTPLQNIRDASFGTQNHPISQQIRPAITCPIFIFCANSLIQAPRCPNIIIKTAKLNMIYFCYPPFINLNNQPLNHSHESKERLTPHKSEQSLVEPRTIFSPTDQLPTMQILPKLKNQKLCRPNKSQIRDADYTPESGSDKPKRKPKQLQNRNVVPNIVRLILSFVQKRGKSQKLVQKLLQQQNCYQATLQRFFNFHKLIKSSMNNYVHQETLTQLTRISSQHFSVYSLQEQQCYSFITRCLISHFLKNQAYLYVFTSKRMDRIKKRDHLLSIKSITQRLREIVGS